MNSALLLIDLQNDYLRAPGLQPAAGQLIENVGRLVHAARKRWIPVIHVWTTIRREDDRRMPHWKRADKWLCVEGTEGHATPPALSPLPAETVIHKTHFSAFQDGSLDQTLKKSNVGELILAGVHLHGCVRATALDAYQHGYHVSIVEDAVGSDDPLHAASTRRWIETRCARFVALGSFVDPRIEPKSEPASGAWLAKESFAGWSARPLGDRVAILRNLRDTLQARSSSLAFQMAVEIGKPITHANAEISRALDLIDAVCARAGEPPQVRCAAGSTIRYRPVGAIAVITPFNNPVAIPVGKIVPALFYGNTVVWKPAPAGAAIARRVIEALHEAGVPNGVVTLAAGDRDAATALMNDPNIDAVTITGGAEAGFAAQDICARRHIPLQAELGGNNGAIVWSDCDIENAARQIAEGAFGFAGQRCTANRRAIVDERCYDRFVERLQAATAALVCGDPLDPRTQVGPMISVAAHDRVAALVERARTDSESVCTPRGSSPPLMDAFFPPTIVRCDDSSREIVQEETFGPVLVVQRAANWDHAIQLCNGVRQGLVAALFSKSKDLRDRFLATAQAGILKLNVSTVDANAEAPFGGWKASGIGPPEHGPSDREFYTRTQTVYEAERP